MTRQDSGTTGTLNETQAAASTRWVERGLALALLLWGFLFSLGCTPSSLGDDDIFALPLEIEEDEDGVFVSRLENPTIWGWTVGDDLSFRDEDPSLDEIQRQVYESPETGEAVVVHSDRNVFSVPSPSGSPILGSSSMGYVGIDPDMSSLSFEGVPDRRLKFFELPSVSLPNDHEAVTFELSRRWGQGHITPHPVLETIQMRLADDVIVMPVHVHRLVDSSGEPSSDDWNDFNERVVRDWFDPGRIVTNGVGAFYDTVTDRHDAGVNQGELKQPWYFHPDRIFEEAGIQFHLESYEEIAQGFGLEEPFDPDEGLQNRVEEAGGDVCSRSADSRLSSFVDDYEAVPGIHIFLGGRIHPTYGDGWAPGTYVETAMTCGPSCGDIPDSGRRNFIAITQSSLGHPWIERSGSHNLQLVNPITDENRWPNARQELAHELGHYLGLEHTADSLSCGAPLGPFPRRGADNLMHVQEEASYRGVVSGIPYPSQGTELTDGQVARARQVACQWMRRWELPTSPACGPETPVSAPWPVEEEEESNGLPVDFPIEEDPFQNDPLPDWF